MSKITYLIGAGASYHSIPLVNQLNKKILALMDDVYHFEFKEKYIVDNELSLSLDINEIKKNLQNLSIWLKKELGDNSVDRLAKQLHDLNQKESLRTLKAILSAYIVFEHFNYDESELTQANRDLDPRYPSFFARVSRTEDFVRINNSISIISWNYDLQFEKTYAKYYPHFDFYELFDLLNNYPTLNGYKNFEIEKFKLIRLNGYAGSIINFREKKFHSLLKNFNLQSREDAYNLFIKIFSFLNQPPNHIFSGLRFAFERPFDFYDPVSICEKFLTSTEFLVIIGYSFPDFNREFDSRLIKSMKNLNKVYVQDFANVYNRIKEIFEFESDLKPEIVNIKELNEFYSPPIRF
ncbi:hypothetical protein [Leptospira levettii]|uniref:hypothetical protein n=1 Tax=Leptospira levettii TaxID=2023178 RepID=UPI003EBCF6E6